MERKLTQMTKAQLYELAKQRNVRGRSKMTKAELLGALGRIYRSDRRTSSRLQRSGRRKPGPVHDQAGVGESSPLKTPPPHPSAPQYLTPAPVEAYQGEEGPPLPEHVPVTVLEAMPRDPHWVFLYWEVCSEERDRIQSQYGEWIFERSLPVLRIHDVGARVWRDIPVLLDARNWYLPVMPDRLYQFELALAVPGGEYVVLAASNKVRTPAAEPVLEEGEEWLAVEEYFRELVEVYGDFAPGTFLTSPGKGSGEGHEGARTGRRAGASSSSWGG